MIFIERLFAFVAHTWSILASTVATAAGQFVCIMQRRKNRLQSNQSRYKYGFYDINKCFCKRKFTPSHDAIVYVCCCFCDFDWCFRSRSRSRHFFDAKSVTEYHLNFMFKHRHRAFGHFTIQPIWMVKFRENTAHNSISKYCSAIVDDVYQPTVNSNRIGCKSNSIWYIFSVFFWKTYVRQTMPIHG